MKKQDRTDYEIKDRSCEVPAPVFDLSPVADGEDQIENAGDKHEGCKEDRQRNKTRHRGSDGPYSRYHEENPDNQWHPPIFYSSCGFLKNWFHKRLIKIGFLKQGFWKIQNFVISEYYGLLKSLKDQTEDALSEAILWRKVLVFSRLLLFSIQRFSLQKIGQQFFHLFPIHVNELVVDVQEVELNDQVI